MKELYVEGLATPHQDCGSGSSTQSHWVSSPAGCSITANSADVPAAAHRSHRGRSPRLRSARVNDGYAPSYFSSRTNGDRMIQRTWAATRVMNATNPITRTVTAADVDRRSRGSR